MSAQCQWAKNSAHQTFHHKRHCTVIGQTPPTHDSEDAQNMIQNALTRPCGGDLYESRFTGEVQGFEVSVTAD